MTGAALECPRAGLAFPPHGAAGNMAQMDKPATRLATQGSPAELVVLLDAVARGDRLALAQLYERTSAKMYGICLRLLGNEQDAQDALHDTFLTVWKSAARFDPAKAGAITWLAAVTRNKAIDRLRQRRGPSEPVESAEQLPDDGPSAFDVIEQDQDRQRLAFCLEQLDERARTLIRSAFFAGLTYAELAARDAVPLGTMKSWIRRGLINLRLCLEQ